MIRLFTFFALSLLLSISLNINALDAETDTTTPDQPFSLQQNDCQFSGTFEQIKQLANFDDGLKSSGIFYHHCNNGVIWSTIQPLLETLVMRRDGKGFVINDTGSKQLKSRQGKFLSNLLNALMSGDQSAIEKQFELTTENDGHIRLQPKKRSLKRAIKLIEVQRSLTDKTVNITIVDRNDQKTQINSIQKQAFDDDDILDNCRIATEVIPHKLELSHSCKLLLQTGVNK